MYSLPHERIDVVVGERSSNEQGVSQPRMAFLAGVERTIVRRDPFAHFHLAPALPPDLYLELAAAFPPLEAFTGGRAVPDNMALRIPAHEVVDDSRFPGVWREFFSYHVSRHFWDQLRRLLEPELREAFPALEHRLGRSFDELQVAMRSPGEPADLNIDCQFVVNTPARRPSSVKTAHVDNQYKLWSALLYFRHPDDQARGGDLDFYRFLRPKKFANHRVPEDRIKRCETIAYNANSFVAFVNSPDAVHGVSPRSHAELPRRYINFIGELRVKAFDLPQLNPLARLLARAPLPRVFSAAEDDSGRGTSAG